MPAQVESRMGRRPGAHSKCRVRTCGGFPSIDGIRDGNRNGSGSSINSISTPTAVKGNGNPPLDTETAITNIRKKKLSY